MTTEFPKLMWAPDGREFTVQDQKEQDKRTAEGFRLAVNPVAATPLDKHPAPDTRDPAHDARESHVRPERTTASGPFPTQQEPEKPEPPDKKAKK